MQTLAIFHTGAISGPLRTLLPRVEALAEDGDVRLLFPWEGSGTKLAQDEFAVATAAYTPAVRPAPSEILLTPLRLRRDVSELRRTIRRAEPDVVVVATGYLPQALLAARLERVPSVLYVAEILGGARRVLAATTRLATTVVAPSEAVTERLPGEAEIVQPGIRDSSSTDVALPGTPPRIAVVGALSRGRGQDVALAALPLIRAGFPGAGLLFAGEPHPRPDDRAYADELRAQAGEGVHFLGPVADVSSLFAAVDVVVVPNRVEEGFGRVAFEALAAGTPVVATPFTAAARLLRNTIDLPVTPPDRPDRLAAEVVALLQNADRGAQLVSAGRKWVAANLDEPTLTRRFVEIATAVLERGKPMR